MTIATFDRAAAKLIAEEAHAALQAVAERHGLSLGRGTTAFSAMNATVKFEFATRAENGLVHDRWAEKFTVNCGLFGLEPDDLGRTVTLMGHAYQIIGCRPGSPRHPIIIRSLRGGARICYAADAICRALGRKTQAERWDERRQQAQSARG